MNMENTYYVPDSLFDSNNELEIPNLRLDVQPQAVEIPFVCYGEQRRTFDMRYRGTLHFYTDDYRWQSVYEHPEKILRHHPSSIVEPNYSLFNETPVAFGMNAVYKKRWVARAMQERGIGVFVDLNVANKFYAMNLLGVPMGYSHFCTRGYSDRIPALEFEHKIAEAMADGNRLTFVVYGGGRTVREWCAANGAVYVTPVVAIKDRVKAIERMRQSVALIDGDPLFPELPVYDKLPTVKDLYERQVMDYRKIKTLIQDDNV